MIKVFFILLEEIHNNRNKINIGFKSMTYVKFQSSNDEYITIRKI